MTDDLVKRLRGSAEGWLECDCEENAAMDTEAADRIEGLQDVIARIQYTNLRRDMNLKNRTLEIDKLCKTTKRV